MQADRFEIPEDELVEDYLSAFEFWNDRQPNSITPERIMMLTILENAIREFCGTGSMGHGNSGNHRGRVRNSTARLQHEAGEWFADQNTDHVFSFVPLCGHLGLEPHAVRRELLRLRNAAHMSGAAFSKRTRYVGAD